MMASSLRCLGGNASINPCVEVALDELLNARARMISHSLTRMSWGKMWLP